MQGEADHSAWHVVNWILDSIICVANGKGIEVAKKARKSVNHQYDLQRCHKTTYCSDLLFSIELEDVAPPAAHALR